MVGKSKRGGKSKQLTVYIYWVHRVHMKFPFSAFSASKFNPLLIKQAAARTQGRLCENARTNMPGRLSLRATKRSAASERGRINTSIVCVFAVLFVFRGHGFTMYRRHVRYEYSIQNMLYPTRLFVQTSEFCPRFYASFSLFVVLTSRRLRRWPRVGRFLARRRSPGNPAASALPRRYRRRL